MAEIIELKKKEPVRELTEEEKSNEEQSKQFEAIEAANSKRKEKLAAERRAAARDIINRWGLRRPDKKR